MPLFTYQCISCDSSFETLVLNQKEAEQVACPKCDGKDLVKAFSLPSAYNAEPQTNCRGDGPPCGSSMCGRNR